MPLQSIQFYMGMILIRFQFLINVDSISIISWELLSISITISITETGPYQYQYIINFSKISLSISMSISILHFFLINISLSMHCATLLWTSLYWRQLSTSAAFNYKQANRYQNYYLQPVWTPHTRPESVRMPEGRHLLCNEWRPDEPGETLSEALPRLFQNIGLKK